MILGLQGHKSGIAWKHTEDTTEIHRTSLSALHIQKRPIWLSKRTNQGRAPQILNKGPTRSAPAKDGPKPPQTGFGRTHGCAEPPTEAVQPHFWQEDCSYPLEGGCQYSHIYWWREPTYWDYKRSLPHPLSTHTTKSSSSFTWRCSAPMLRRGPA